MYRSDNIAKVNMSTNLNVPAAELWKFIGGFNSLPDWHPGVEKSELQEEGAVRELTLVGGGSFASALLDQHRLLPCPTITQLDGASLDAHAGTGPHHFKFSSVYSRSSIMRSRSSPGE